MSAPVGQQWALNDNWVQFSVWRPMECDTDGMLCVGRSSGLISLAGPARRPKGRWLHTSAALALSTAAAQERQHKQCTVQRVLHGPCRAVRTPQRASLKWAVWRQRESALRVQAAPSVWWPRLDSPPASSFQPPASSLQPAGAPTFAGSAGHECGPVNLAPRP